MEPGGRHGPRGVGGGDGAETAPAARRALDLRAARAYLGRVVRLNKKTEYALLALRYLNRQTSGPASSREIAGHYNIPEMLLAKVLQRLKRRGFVDATKGAGGGYALATSLDELPLLDLLSAFDEQTHLVACLEHADDCAQLDQCDIRGPLAVLNRALLAPLREMTVEDLFVADIPAGRPDARGGRSLFAVR